MWATTKVFESERRNDHKTFYCPNGCPRHYPQESDKERLKRQLKQEKSCCAMAKQEADYFFRSSNAYKGHFNRVKAKIKENHE